MATGRTVSHTATASPCGPSGKIVKAGGRIHEDDAPGVYVADKLHRAVHDAGSDRRTPSWIRAGIPRTVGQVRRASSEVIAEARRSRHGAGSSKVSRTSVLLSS